MGIESYKPKSLPERDQRFAESIAENLKGPLRNILSKLREHLNRGEYQVVIGEDASGRLPTMAIHQIISSIYKEKGYPSPRTLFLAGSGGLSFLNDPTKQKEKELRTYVEHLLETIPEGGRILIMTDYIQTGKSMSKLVKVLNENGAAYDIATIGVESEEIRASLEEKWGHSIHAGQNANPLINNKKGYSGVTKDPKKLHARRLQPGDKETFANGELKRDIHDEFTQERINEARKQVKEISESLSTEYLDI